MTAKIDRVGRVLFNPPFHARWRVKEPGGAMPRVAETRNGDVVRAAAANWPDGQISSDFQKSCQAPESKIYLFSQPPNHFTSIAIPSCSEGRWPSSRTLDGLRWTRELRLTIAA
jgi:hypothetical protein